jgi:hypothetical protein
MNLNLSPRRADYKSKVCRPAAFGPNNDNRRNKRIISVSHPFAEQMQFVDRILGDGVQFALCVGSGISRRRLPMLAELIAAALNNLPATPESADTFARYSRVHVFALRLADAGIRVNDPCELNDFRGIGRQRQSELCEPLVATYGDIFRDLLPLYGSKENLLRAIDFDIFVNAEPDVAHSFIAYLIVEGRITRVLTTNWDRLIEKAVQYATSRDWVETTRIVLDDPTWLDRLVGPPAIIAKVHGCASQYPLSVDQIVITTADLHAAAAPGWRHDAVRELLSGRVLFCGYSGSDYTLMVPAVVIGALRQNAALQGAEYFIADETQLSAGARQLNGDVADRHLPMYANDTFASLYFSFLRKRFGQAIETANQQTRPERAFTQWTDAVWQAVLLRLRNLLNNELPEWLDSLIGDPHVRKYEDSIATIPIHLSVLRQLFLEGQVRNRSIYEPFRFDPVKDIVLLILIAAFVDLCQSSSLAVKIDSSFSGLTIFETTGATRSICFVYGTYVSSVERVINLYLDSVEDRDGQLPHFEVIVVPCSHYQLGGAPAQPPRPVLAKRMPGMHIAKRRFIDPERVFECRDYDELINNLRDDLGV